MFSARRGLILAVICNLLLLSYFKYVNFFIQTGNQLFAFGIGELDVLLPLGISFFTFTQIAFLVDVYRGIAREYNFIHYLLFITWFPHLIAGPVLHHKQMMPQFGQSDTWRINADNVALGLTVFVLGLAKKILIADNLSRFATPVFWAASEGQVLTLAEAWTGALAYTLQLYFDFSAYSEMAIGLSLMFNVLLPLNFDSPYKATSIIEFWRRWHMTLSAFLRDYLYIPLGGKRHGAARRYLNLMITMLLGGLWHGAGWTFIVWGALHGAFLVVNHLWRYLKMRFGWQTGGFVGHLAAGGLTFLLVVIGWVFFRADSLGTALGLLKAMAGLTVIDGEIPEGGLKMIIPSLLIVWLCPNVRQIMGSYRTSWEDLQNRPLPSRSLLAKINALIVWKPTRGYAVVMAILFLAAADRLSRTSEFLYFQF